MARGKTTSKRIARMASRLLRRKSTPKRIKSVAASALSQKPSRTRKRR